MWFISEGNYMQFLESYLEFSQKTHIITSANILKKRQNTSIPKEDFLKVSNKFMDPDSISNSKRQSNEIDDILKQNKDINFILDKMDESKQKHQEEEIKKIVVCLIFSFFSFYIIMIFFNYYRRHMKKKNF